MIARVCSATHRLPRTRMIAVPSQRTRLPRCGPGIPFLKSDRGFKRVPSAANFFHEPDTGLSSDQRGKIWNENICAAPVKKKISPETSPPPGLLNDGQCATLLRRPEREKPVFF